MTGSIPVAPDPDQGGVSIHDLQKHFRRSDGTLVTAVDGVTLQIRPGEFCVLLGPSGCGKTTLLRCIAGLEHPDRGEIRIGSRTVYDSAQRLRLDPRARHLGMVFQTYALWPHMSVRDNVGFPLTTRRRLRGRRAHRARLTERVSWALSVVGIPELRDQSVASLSGGQQQRVALARAIVAGDRTILFDEPLSNVDAQVRVQLRQEIRRLQRELGFTALYVTHDQEEAMELADRLVVLNDGQIEQQGSPREIYRTPISQYVADFIGTTDVLAGKVVATGEPPNGTAAGEPGVVVVETAIGRCHVAAGARVALGDEVAVAFRAEDWELPPEGAAPAENSWVGTVESTAFLGAFTQYVVRVGDQPLRVRVPGDPAGDMPPDGGQKLPIRIPPARCKLVER